MIIKILFAFLSFNKKIKFIYFSNFDIGLNFALADMVVIKDNQYINAYFMLFWVIYINYNYKLLAKIRI